MPDRGAGTTQNASLIPLVKQGDPKLCRCGRTEFFPVGCPCQKQEPKK